MRYKIIIATVTFFALISCHSNSEKENQQENHSIASNIMYAKPKVDIKTIGIFLYDGYTALDAMGPYQVLGGLRDTEVFFIGKTKGLIKDSRGMQVQVDTTIAEVKQLDILLIPGGLNETYLQTKDIALISWIKAIDVNSKYTTSVCMGSWVLGAAGLLEDKEATSHWYGKKILEEEFGAKVKNARYVKSGKYWTSAGITAGMDMSLALVNEIMGKEYTQMVMLNLEYDPEPPVRGGSEQNTDRAIVESVRNMYDGAIKAVKNPNSKFEKMKFHNTKDFVCKMPLTAGVGDTLNYKDKLYGFCSKRCKEEFAKNTAAYLELKQ